MMTSLTLKMFCLQNRHDITHVDLQRHVLGFDVTVTFNDNSNAHLRFIDGVAARETYDQLMEYITP